ncbi:MAG: hypothetical protein L3J35_11625 [Bacteroidales bacterium]|nr:hypothetical protein [Bacteroidales bacterium]
MSNNNNILIIIPARGGSKGIPRKNLRYLNGKPLIYYSVKTALNSVYNPTVVVSSEDREILDLAKKIGADTIKRNPKLATDEITLDSVIYDTYIKAEKIYNKKFSVIITLQPTSPLLKTESLDNAVRMLIKNPELDSVISAKDDTHLSWKKENGKFIPNYKERLNRQFLKPIYKETGGFFITNSEIITKTDRIGQNVELYLLKNGEDIDIDTYEDWSLCEYYLRRKKILFVTSGYKEIGLGHIYRTVIIANDILNHELIFLTDKKSKAGFEKIKSLNYNVHIQKSEKITDDIAMLKPNIIINDILDTDIEYMQKLKSICSKIINFEDCGKGSEYADIVINALYPEKKKTEKNYYSGHKYFIARDEFILSETTKIKENAETILISFGGTDPNNYTLRILNIIYDFCISNNIKIDVIAGLGYTNCSTLKKFNQINLKKNVSNISTYMAKADIIFSSAGRTVYEIATIGTPSIILCQNKRETTHLFANKENGFINLGEAYKISDNEIFKTFKDLINNFTERKTLSSRMLKKDLKKGRKRTLKIISNFITD